MHVLRQPDLTMARSRSRSLRELLRVQPGSKVRLADIDPADAHGYTKAGSADELQKGLDRLTELQDRLWAEEKHPILVVLQGMDTAGKDGSIKHVMRAFNPMGCSVTVVQGADADRGLPRLPLAGPSTHAGQG